MSVLGRSNASPDFWNIYLLTFRQDNASPPSSLLPTPIGFDFDLAASDGPLPCEQGMLAFGVKVAWFCLSITGLLSSIAALPAFAQALDGYLFPVLYSIMNLVLQGLLCLGMIWRMDPFEMPRAFCLVQPALMGVAWAFITVIIACVTLTTSSAILRPAGGVLPSSAYIRSHLRWHRMCLPLAVLPIVAFTAYLILMLKFDAVKPVDGMYCDATNPVWVRLLSYAGVPLLLALPSFALTCTAAVHHYTHYTRYSHSFLVPQLSDNLTSVPLRRPPRRQSKVSQASHEAETFDEPVPFQTALPKLSPSTTKRSTDQLSITPSGTIVEAEVVPSPPDSFSSAKAQIAVGRAPVSPAVAKPGMGYHLPFQWQNSSPRTSPDPLRDSPELAYSRNTPSPLVFAKSRDGSHCTTAVSVTSEYLQRAYEAAPWLKDEKEYWRQPDRTFAARHESHDDDRQYDAVSGSLRWVHNSDDTVSTVKSELEFAQTPQRQALNDALTRPSPVHISIYDNARTEAPIPNLSRVVWRILFFQLLTSAMQILATISSLSDMFAKHSSPTAFGTNHISLLLATWAPAMAFGFVPWR